MPVEWIASLKRGLSHEKKPRKKKKRGKAIANPRFLLYN